MIRTIASGELSVEDIWVREPELVVWTELVFVDYFCYCGC